MIKVYGANWCQPCLRVKQILNEFNINYEFYDADNDTALFLEKDISVLPHIEFYDRVGNLKGVHSGAIGKTHLIKLINKANEG